MNEAISTSVYQRVQRLLSKDEHTLTAALPVLGTLAFEGWIGQEVDQAKAQAKALGLDYVKLLADRIEECMDDLNTSSGMDLGIALVDAQGLVALSKAEDRKFGWPAWYAGEKLFKAAIIKAATLEDEEAADYVRAFQRIYELPEIHQFVFLGEATKKLPPICQAD